MVTVHRWRRCPSGLRRRLSQKLATHTQHTITTNNTQTTHKQTHKHKNNTQPTRHNQPPTEPTTHNQPHHNQPHTIHRTRHTIHHAQHKTQHTTNIQLTTQTDKRKQQKQQHITRTKTRGDLVLPSASAACGSIGFSSLDVFRGTDVETRISWRKGRVRRNAVVNQLACRGTTFFGAL